MESGDTAQGNTAIQVYDSARPVVPLADEMIELIRYRDLVRQLIHRNLTSRYKRSVLGIGWTMLNPLLTMAILALVFSHLFRFAVDNYVVYLLSGLVFWNFFGQSTSFAMNELVWGGSLLSRIYVPPAVFVVAALGTGLVNLGLSLVPLLVIMVVTGAPLGWALASVVPAILLLAMFTLGVGLLMSTLALFFADVSDMYQIVLLAWMYLTPIIYPKEIIPEQYRFVVTHFNPVYYLLETFRSPFCYGTVSDPTSWALATCAAVGALILGWYVFSHKSAEFAYRV